MAAGWASTRDSAQVAAAACTALLQCAQQAATPGSSDTSCGSRAACTDGPNCA